MKPIAIIRRVVLMSLGGMLSVVGGCAGASKGSDTYNSDLSQRRAQAVEGFLLSNGIGGERIAARGHGEAYPVASNDTMAGRQQNRRVEIVVSEHPQQVGVSREQ